MKSHMRGGAAAALFSALITFAAIFAAPASKASATQDAAARVLEASDHAELSAEVSASGVVRIALVGDRIARTVRAPGGHGIEHDPASGDLYLRPRDLAGGGADRAAEPTVLFIGTEKGFTYRLTLTPAEGGPAQLLIGNPAAGTAATREAPAGDRRVGALVRLVRAVARREPLAGHAIHAGGVFPGLTVIETWRGPRFSALVFEAGPLAPAEGAADLAGTIGGLPGVGRLAALWLAAPGTGPTGGRLAVAVREDAPPAGPRHAGNAR